ncbi:MAG: TetR/AcrR family transcriptional regulator [Actinomycetota bacterium]|nr:TetR/AcrR family transcriptional regulator [Actinomycetota bacterium]
MSDPHPETGGVGPARRGGARGSTPERLLDAAEELFARDGVEGVSLREITRTSGARNTTALQYHFGDRDGLVRAIVDRHLPAVEAQRHALLDAYEAAGTGDLRVLAGALVRPYAAKLDDGASGCRFLQIYAELFHRPNPTVDPAKLQTPGNSVYRWRTLVDPLLDDDAVRLHRRFTTISYTVDQIGDRARNGPNKDNRLFTSYLTDTVTAILTAPTSEETRRLAAERDAARARRAG